MEMNDFVYKIIVADIKQGEKVQNILFNLGLEWEHKYIQSLLGYNLPEKVFIITSDGFKFLTISAKYPIEEAREVTIDELQKEDFLRELNKVRILARLKDE